MKCASLAKLALHSDISTKIKDAALSQAASLDLSFQELTELPLEVTELNQLRRLTLRRNYLTSLPPEFRRLTKLREVNL
ncbi:MAG: hypothetical protein D3903_22220, partial [Candidatus Electrothrix sp. GM3_4]|nr:hypothetical protein [Candidatus Electrothrix sp. GM3_4]